MFFFQRLRIRIARRRLTKALDACTVTDLKRATALQRWFETNKLLPGDKVTITFDGEHTDVVISDLVCKYFKEREELLKEIKQ